MKKQNNRQYSDELLEIVGGILQYPSISSQTLNKFLSIDTKNLPATKKTIIKEIIKAYDAGHDEGFRKGWLNTP